MNNLSQIEQERIEADFLRGEADREAAEKLTRARKKEKIKSDSAFEAVQAFSVFAAGFLFTAGFYPQMLGPALMMAAIWIVAVGICILKMRASIQQSMAQQIGTPAERSQDIGNQ